MNKVAMKWERAKKQDVVDIFKCLGISEYILSNTEIKFKCPNVGKNIIIGTYSGYTTTDPIWSLFYRCEFKNYIKRLIKGEF